MILQRVPERKARAPLAPGPRARLRARRRATTETPGWAHRYDEATKQALLGADPAALLALPRAHPDGPRAHPTPDHWLPLIYAAGATDERDSVQFPIEGFDLGSISMRCMVWS